MQPRTWSWALAIAALGAVTYLAGLVFFALTGCASTLPEEPGYIMVTTADAAYIGR